MSRLPTRRQTAESNGFTLVEVLVAISILAVGLMAAALLMSITFKDSVRSRYVAEAAQLASEKLEDLNRFPASNSSGVVSPSPYVFVPSGSSCTLSSSTTGTNCVGSIAAALVCTSGTCTANAAATPQSITAGQVGAGSTTAASAATVNYSDTVFITATNAGSSSSTPTGTLQETYQTGAGTTPTYETLTFNPNGTTPTIATSTTAPTTGETFDRRWIIEQDQPVAGVRRITVLVTLMDQTVQPPVTFQMSMVRP